MATDSIDIYDELSKLRAFFREVAELTKEHDVLNDNAVVYPNKLGEALERVDPNWARGVTEDSLPRTVQCKQCLGIMNEGNGCALPECPIGVALPSQAALDSPSVEFPRSIKTPEERRAFIMGVAAGSLGAGKIDVDDIAWATGKDGVTGTFNEQEKGLAARPTSRGDLLEIEPNDRRPEESHRGTGEKEQRGGKAGRCDATRAGSAELGTRGGDAAPHEVAQDGGTGNGAAHGAAEDFSPCAICESPELCKQEGCSSAEWKRTHGVSANRGECNSSESPMPD